MEPGQHHNGSSCRPLFLHFRASLEEYAALVTQYAMGAIRFLRLESTTRLLRIGASEPAKIRKMLDGKGFEAENIFGIGVNVFRANGATRSGLGRSLHPTM